MFKQSLDCECYSKRNQQLHSAMALYDLSNYYEHINRSKLATRALRNGFPATLLRIILGVYATPRYVAFQDLVMYVGHTVYGIAAGCGFATYLIQMYTIDPLDSWTQRNPSLDLHMFIDDILLKKHALNISRIASALNKATHSLLDCIQTDLDSKIEPT